MHTRSTRCYLVSSMPGLGCQSAPGFFLCLSHPLGEMRESPLTIGCGGLLGFFVLDVPSPRSWNRLSLGLSNKYRSPSYAYLIGNMLAR
jgi:hypothetical protein